MDNSRLGCQLGQGGKPTQPQNRMPILIWVLLKYNIFENFQEGI